MTEINYGQFCPIAMASEILGTRWIVMVLREMIAGSTRFNDLRRGVPRMSPALLSKRLKELEDAGVVQRIASETAPGVSEYHLTRSGRDLKPVILAMGIWGQRWIAASEALEKLDVSYFMWGMRQFVNAGALPKRRCTVLFQYPEQAEGLRKWWLVVAPGAETDVCTVDPGFDVDLYVTTDLRSMTAIWIGLTTVREAIKAKKMDVTGDRQLAANMQIWLGLSPFAVEKKLAAG
ncbi:MAG: transcriptional regulator [Alphaproteobacteria bacterium]|nr:transcriptional regulator [Alphaproteobacteria bacterium]